MRNKGFQKVCRWLIAFLIVIYPFSPLSNNLMVSKAVGSFALNYSTPDSRMGSVDAINTTHNDTTIEPGGSVNEGDSVTLTATPEEGYSFYRWERLPSGSDTATSVTFEMPSNDLDITARFMSNTGNTTLTLTVDPQGGGTIAGTAYEIDAVNEPVSSSQKTSLPGGAYVTIGATPSEGYSFDAWGLPEGLSAEKGDESGISFYMPNSDTTVTAHFTQNVTDKTLTLSVSPQGGGSIQGQVAVGDQNITEINVTDTQENSFQEGASVTISPTANEGYYFDKWEFPEGLSVTEGDGSSISFTMPNSDVSITARFLALNTLTFTPSDRVMGTVSGMVNEQYIDTGSNVSPESSVILEATPRYGYEFDRWEFSDEFSDYEVDNQKVSFLMPSHSLTVVAHFKATEYGFTLAVDPTKGGVIKDKDGNIVNLGTIHYSQVTQMTRSLVAEVSFTTNPLDYTAEPNPGYKFKNWVVAMGEDYNTSRMPEGWDASLTNPSQSIQLNSTNFLLPIYSGFTLTAVFEKEEVPVTEPTTDSQPIDTNSETDTIFPKTSDDFNFSPYVITMLLSAGMYFFLKIGDRKSNKEAEQA